MPKISIITINLNNREGLEKTIRSVACQTVKDIEYIVIDGASDDGSVEVIKENETKIDFWLSESDGGVYHAMNKGIDHSKGNYLLFLNSGDCLADEQVLEKFIKQIPQEDMLYGSSLFVKNETVVAKKVYPSTLRGMELYYYTLNHQSIFFKKTLFEGGNRYDTSYQILADWVFYMNALFFQQVSYKRLDFIISHYDYSGISSSEGSSAIIIKEKERYYIEHADFFIPHFISEHTKLKTKHRKLLKGNNSLIKAIKRKVNKILFRGA